MYKRQVLKSARPVRGDRITVRIPEPKVLDVEAENIPLEIVYEDAEDVYKRQIFMPVKAMQQLKINLRVLTGK